MSDGLYIQLEYRYTEGRVRQRNLSLADFLDEIQKELKHFARADLNDSGGSASLLFSRKGKITLVTHGSIGDGDKLSIAGNNRKKRYILDGSEPFLMRQKLSQLCRLPLSSPHFASESGNGLYGSEGKCHA